MSDPWPFDQPPNCAVFTSTHVMKHGMPITHVYHDEDDHGWQFHSEEGATMEHAMIVALKEVAKVDESVLEVADLLPGWVARRSAKGGRWTRTLNSAFAQAFLYLAAALVAILVGKRFGLGAVLGYLIAGALIGPWGLGWIGRGGGQVTHFAEFGVVMMIFLVGLELEPSHLWKMRRQIFGLGSLPVACSALAVGTALLMTKVGLSPALGAFVAGVVLANSEYRHDQKTYLNAARESQRIFETVMRADLPPNPADDGRTLPVGQRE